LLNHFQSCSAISNYCIQKIDKKKNQIRRECSSFSDEHNMEEKCPVGVGLRRRCCCCCCCCRCRCCCWSMVDVSAISLDSVKYLQY
uniref:CYSTM domain-containing protein n=1 Tax=Angiostrongylus cantonensis TaxID=6313 RepID=A0A0K0DK61_ANGCA